MPKLGAKRFSGLYTDPNSNDLPPDAMARADNVVIRRPGVVEPRPGFDTAGMTPPSTYYLRTLFHYDGQMFGWSYKSSGSPTWTLMRGSTTITSVGLAADPTKVQPKQAIAKGNLYFTSSTGVRKLTSVSDNAAELAGLERPRSPACSPTGTAGFLAVNKDATYRAVWYKTDPDTEQKYFSPPSASDWATASGTAQNVTVTWYPPVNATSGDSIQIYRSLQNTTSDDELYLAREVKITSTEINAASGSFTDTTTDANLGASLYSNVSQDGSTQENNMPPIALDLAWFKGSMWYANTESQAKLLFTVQGGGSGAASYLANASEWGVHSLDNCQVQVGATTITSVTEVVGIEVGQYVTDHADGPLYTGTIISSVTTVTSWNANGGAWDVHISKPALITVGGASTFTAYRRDWMQVNTSTELWYAAIGTEPNAADKMLAADDPTIANKVRTLANTTSAWGVTGWDLGNTSASGSNSSASTLLESQTPGANAFKITSSKALAFSPRGGAAADTKLVLSTDDIPGRLMWSKQHQQEAVPEFNYTDVGDPQKDILRIIPTTDALFVFKRDGTFRVTGEGALSGWRVDDFAPDLVLLLAECVCKLDDAIYAWTNRGVVRIDSGGVLKLSGPIEDVLRAATLAFSLAPAQSGASYGAGEMVAHPIHQEIWFNLPASASVTRGTVYVYSIRNNTWTKFTSPLARAMALNEATGLMWFESGTTSSATGVRAERSPTSAYWHSDLTRTGITVNSTTVTAVNIAAGSGWTPAAGDYFVSGSFESHVASIVSATRFFCASDASDATDTATAYEAYTVAIEPIAANYDPTGTMIVTDGAWFFDELKLCDEVTVGYTTDLATTAGSEVVATTSTGTADIPEKLRYFVPTTHQICTEYRPKLTIKQAVTSFRLSAWSARYEPWEDEEP